MTLRNTTLTAVAALTVALAGGAIAQDASTAPGTTAPAGSSYHSGATAEQPATEAPAAAADAAEAGDSPEATQDPAAEAPATEAATTEAAAVEPAEAPEQPATAAPATAAEETPAEAAPAAEAAPTEAQATEAQATEPATEAPAAETAEEAPAAAEAPAEPAAPAAEAPAEEAAAEEAPAESAPVEEAAAEAVPAEEAHAEEPAAASHGGQHIEDISYSFEGPFGKYDQFQLQRGLQVYTEVCSACHGLRYVPIRTLSDANGVGLPEDQVKAYAANLAEITDAETGEDRPRIVTDHFPTIPHADGMGPDLSLMAKARAGFHGPYGTGVSQFLRGIGGPEYIHAVLTGYDGETKEEAGSTFYHNAAFAGNWIQMPAPLTDDQVTYEDGTPATVDQMARDVSAFLMWTAEPKLMDRKQVGLISVLFMIVLAALLYLTNKRLWWPIKHRDDSAH